MVQVTATKEVRYAGQNYVPGDKFEASEKDANILSVIGKVSVGEVVPAITDLPEKAMEPASVEPEADELTELRGEYQTVVGRRPFMGWNADTIRDKINSYRTRDMRAGE